MKFLGHAITTRFVVVDRCTTKSVLDKVELQNVSSYLSLKLIREAKMDIHYRMLEKILDLNENLL